MSYVFLIVVIVGMAFLYLISVVPALKTQIWLVVIPAMLLLLAMWIISKYELDDEVIDKINREIEKR